MANFDETPAWPTVTKLTRSDKVDAGLAGDGKANLHGSLHTQRTAFLRRRSASQTFVEDTVGTLSAAEAECSSLRVYSTDSDAMDDDLAYAEIEIPTDAGRVIAVINERRGELRLTRPDSDGYASVASLCTALVVLDDDSNAVIGSAGPFNRPIVIDSMTPDHAPSGDTVTVTLDGHGFLGVCAVQWEALDPVTFSVVSDNQMTVTLGGYAGSGSFHLFRHADFAVVSDVFTWDEP